MYGKAFENRLFHELSTDNSYWGLPSGIEVDFIVNDMEIAIDAKATNKD